MTAPAKPLIASISAARLSMSRWLVGSSSTTRCGPSKHASASSRRDFSPPHSLGAGVSAAGADPGLGRVRHQAANVIIGASRGVELVELMLGEIGDLEPVGARDAALA